MDVFKCPICNESHKTLIRYSNCVCNNCLNNYKTKDKEGNIKEFYNVDVCGGIYCICNKKNIDEFSCYVNNIECTAYEARFGGIVIIPNE